MICPHDGYIADEVFWCDNVRRWKCRHCGRVLCEKEYANEDGFWVRRGKGIKAKMKKIPYKAINSELPSFKHAHKNDAGYDLYSAENIWIRAGETETVQTNLRVCIPKGYVGLVTGRSGNSSRGLLCHLGTIDAGYTGPIWVVLSNLNKHMAEIKQGDRIAQMVILKLPDVELVEGDLPETERGDSGLGSTGR